MQGFEIKSYQNAKITLQCGAAQERKNSRNEMLDAWPDPRTGENCFHVFARNNYAREIKRYSDDDGHAASFTRLCLEANNQVSFGKAAVRTG